MNKQLKIGEYGRTNLGNIFIFAWLVNADGIKYKDKVILIENGKVINNFYYFKENEKIIKNSKNIFELLENGDIVILEYYVSKYKKRIIRNFEIYKADNESTLISFENAHCNFLYDLQKNQWLDGKGFNPKIKKIMTHNEFANIGYDLKL